MPPEKRQHFLSNINKSSERLLDLVNDLSKISTARNLKPDETAQANVNDVLTDILSLNSSHQLQIETNKDVPDVNMEPELLNSIVTSIIENAKRHGGNDVSITITSKFDDTNKMVQLQVSNDGKSISEDISDRIFEPFFSTVRDYTRKSGSGLAYVKALLIAHGGDIVLLPNTDKVTFELTIPT
jgi:signal transduction histidine kinase